jgi:hypothetical protein
MEANENADKDKYLIALNKVVVLLKELINRNTKILTINSS